MTKIKQVKTKRIEVEYTDGRKFKIVPYIYEGKQGYGLETYDKKGRFQSYEGSQTPETISNWFREILEDDCADYAKELSRIQEMYSP